MKRRFKPRYQEFQDLGWGVHALHLPCGKVALLDSSDVAAVSGYTWHAIVNRCGTWYVQAKARDANDKLRTVILHRIITGAPRGMHVDHINHDGLDNRRANIRIATPSQNHANRRKSSGCTSSFKGVSWSKRDQKWLAIIHLNYKRIYLGVFDSEIDAAKAYDKRAVELHGEFALTNFPNDHGAPPQAQQGMAA